MAVEQAGLFGPWVQWNHRVADYQRRDIFTVRDILYAQIDQQPYIYHVR
jgi:hypothetical protein